MRRDGRGKMCVQWKEGTLAIESWCVSLTKTVYDKRRIHILPPISGFPPIYHPYHNNFLYRGSYVPMVFIFSYTPILSFSLHSFFPLAFLTYMQMDELFEIRQRLYSYFLFLSFFYINFYLFNNCMQLAFFVTLFLASPNIKYQ